MFLYRFISYYLNERFYVFKSPTAYFPAVSLLMPSSPLETGIPATSQPADVEMSYFEMDIYVHVQNSVLVSAVGSVIIMEVTGKGEYVSGRSWVLCLMLGISSA